MDSEVLAATLVEQTRICDTRTKNQDIMMSVNRGQAVEEMLLHYL